MNIISLYSEEKDPNGDIYYSFKEPKNNKWEQIAEQNYKLITNLIKEINHLTKKLEEESQKILVDDNTLNTYKKTLLYAVKDIYSNLLEILNNFNINSYSIIHLRKECNLQYNYYEDYYDQPEDIYMEEPIFLSYGQVLTSLSENDLKNGKYIELYAYDILKEDINKIYSQNIKKLLSIKQLNSYRKKG